MPETVALPGSLQGYLSVPDGPEPRPGVVVLHEALGLTDDIRGIADRFAAEGFVAVAPDLFSWGSTSRCLMSTFRDLVRREGEAHERVDAVGEWLAAQPSCTGRVGIIGFCMGGGFALLAATRDPFAASAVNYGLVPHHAARLERALAANGVDHDVKEYPGVGHSFMNHHVGWAARLDRIGLGHGEAEAEDTWARILGYFSRYLA